MKLCGWGSQLVIKMDTPVLFRLVGQLLLISHVGSFCVEIKPAVLLATVAGAWYQSLYQTNPKCSWVKGTDLAQDRCSI